MPITKNIVTDYGCPTDGTTDCRTAFLAFKADAQGQNAVLTAPLHTYKFGAAGSAAASRIFEGISSLVVEWGGSTIIGQDINLGSLGIAVASPQSSARVQSAIAGQEYIDLVTTSDASIFISGRWVCLTAIDLQGFGSPPNPYYYEFLKIQSINSGRITFSSSLQYSYLSSFPLYSPGSSFEPDLGGPATLYVLPAEWDLDFEFRDLVMARTDGQQTLCRGRNMTFTRCTDANSSIIPSANKLWTETDCNFGTAQRELDKLVDRMVISGGSAKILFQSPCPNLLTATNSALTFNGTPKKSVIVGGSIAALPFGPTGYGRTESFQATGAVISQISAVSYPNDISSFSISDGIITFSGAQGWAVPGVHMIFKGSRDNETGFNIIGISKPSSDTEVTTDISGSWPEVLGYPTLRIRPHPCPVLNLSNCTGCSDAIDLSQTEAQGRPIYEYSKRSYTGDTLAAPDPFTVWGEIVQIKVTVSKAYTGSHGTLTLKPFGQFFASAALSPEHDALSSWDAVFDLKTVGVRIITASSVSGIKTGDSVSAPGAIWFASPMTPFCSSDISGEPSAVWPVVEVEVIADQGIDPDPTTAETSHAGSRIVRQTSHSHSFSRKRFDELMAAIKATEERAADLSVKAGKRQLRAAAAAAKQASKESITAREAHALAESLKAAASAKALADRIDDAQQAVKQSRAIMEQQDDDAMVAFLMMN